MDNQEVGRKRRGLFSKSFLEDAMKIREACQAIEHYFNQIEQLFEEYTTAEVKEDKLLKIAMMFGKAQIHFSNMCNIAKIFDED
ncbi:MAG: hypothetical protein LBF97_03640 [Elusimicrobiota bacterium]|jgi:hypothetical protein|nr:hypothetical protein [Elusimicrobiota bacterium]